MAWVTEHPALTCVLIGPRTEEQVADLLGVADLRLDADTLDAIDEVVAPGTNINAADAGWSSPGLDISARRSG